jgi:hypothetical protein
LAVKIPHFFAAFAAVFVQMDRSVDEPSDCGKGAAVSPTEFCIAACLGKRARTPSRMEEVCVHGALIEILIIHVLPSQKGSIRCAAPQE